jgi:hypothetical protein
VRCGTIGVGDTRCTGGVGEALSCVFEPSTTGAIVLGDLAAVVAAWRSGMSFEEGVVEGAAFVCFCGTRGAGVTQESSSLASGE